MEITSQELKAWSEVKAIYSPKVKPSERPQIKSSYDAYNILRVMFEENMDYYESFVVMMLNRGNRVIGVNVVSVGGIDSTVVDPKKIFQVALLANASNLILAHNHPSGNLFPSDSDINLTEKIKSASKLLDMKVLDHLIINNGKYYSFGDEGKI